MNNVSVIKISHSDKIIHVSAYFLLTLSWLLSMSGNVKSLLGSLLIAFIIFVYGIIIEVLQGTFTNARQADIFDILANFTGILIAFFVFMKVLRKKSNEINNILAKVVLKLLN